MSWIYAHHVLGCPTQIQPSGGGWYMPPWLRASMCSSATRFAATALDVARTFEGWHTVGSWTVTIGAWCKRLTLALELQSKWISSYIALRWFPERRIPEASPICPIQTVVQATVQLKHLFAKLHFPWLLDQWARFVATSASFRIFIFWAVLGWKRWRNA